MGNITQLLPPNPMEPQLPEDIFANEVPILEALQKRGEQLPIDEVWPGFAAGEVGALVAPGAGGKTFWALQASIAVAGGWSADTINLYPDESPKEPGRVLYLATEDSHVRLFNRISSISQRLDSSAWETVANNFTLFPIAGKGLDLSYASHQDRVINAAEGARLIVLDTFAKAHTLEENSNSDMSIVMNGLYRIADEAGAAVLFCHHVAKGAWGQTGNQHAARGASALTDGGRWAAALGKLSADAAGKWQYVRDLSHPHTTNKQSIIDKDDIKKFVKFEVNKQNHGEYGPGQRYRHGPGGVLIPCVIEPVDGEENSPSQKTSFKAKTESFTG